MKLAVGYKSHVDGLKAPPSGALCWTWTQTDLQ